jgi:hypothetical protein
MPSRKPKSDQSRLLNFNLMNMKKITIYILSLLTSIFLFSCDSNKKLKQENAYKAILEFYQSYRPGFPLKSITSIEPINQFAENEASTIVHFNVSRFSHENENLVLKFNFKRNIEKNWILTSIEGVAGVDSDEIRKKLNNWQNINILAQ